MSGLFAGTSLERPVTCEVCGAELADCSCPRDAGGKAVRIADIEANVRLEKRRKGKTVTVIRGLDPAAFDLKALAKDLRNACGAGGTVGDDGVEVQGDHREKAAAVLRERGFRVTVAGP